MRWRKFLQNENDKFYKLIFFEKIENRFKKRLLKYSIAWIICVFYIYFQFSKLIKMNKKEVNYWKICQREISLRLI